MTSSFAATLRGHVWMLALTIVFTVPGVSRGQGPDTVTVRSGSLLLRGLIWTPGGKGPFPAVLFNHGSWPANTTSGRPAREIFAQAATLGPVFARHRYVFLFLFRRGVGLSTGQGSHAGDLMQKELATNGQEARNHLQIRLLETDELSDALAGLRFLRSLSKVNSRKIAIAGHSFGGALTLLLAERDSRIRGAVDFGGGAGSWEASPELRARLVSAVRALTVPVFFVHAANDYSTAPGKILSAEMARLNKPQHLRIYPPFGTSTSDGHNLVDLGVAIWERDVFDFLDNHLRH